MTYKIDTVSARARLKPRREPYWHRIAKGNYLGHRKLSATSEGTWIARSKDEASGKQQYQALGDFSELAEHQRFDAASKAASAWFQHLGRGGRTEVATVADAARAYLAELRADNRTEQAAHAEAQLILHVLPHKIAGIALSVLREKDVTAWRRDLRDKPTPQGKARAGSTVNRVSNLLRAVLNQALRDGYATTNRPWKEPLARDGSAERSGGVYLDREQRRALLAHASPDARPFFEALTLLPARPGAVAALKAGNFDTRTGILHILEDKANGNRRIKLQGRAGEFFAAQVDGKASDALMFTNSRGTAWDKDAWSYQFRIAADAAKLPQESSAYDLRHSGITDLLTAGTPAVTVAKWAGTSVAQIERHYHHHAPEHNAEALEALAL